jgi:tyrosyl-tRNA synthetase
MNSLKIERPQRFGGDIEFYSQEELENSYVGGKLHPTDLKRGVANALDRIIDPIRVHFEKDPSAKRLLDVVRSAETTR